MSPEVTTRLRLDAKEVIETLRAASSALERLPEIYQLLGDRALSCTDAVELLEQIDSAIYTLDTASNIYSAEAGFVAK